MKRLGQICLAVLKWLGKFIFKRVPRFFYENLIQPCLQDIWGGFKNLLRRNASWIIFSAIFLSLLATKEHHQILNTLFTYTVVTGLVGFGTWALFRAFFSKKKRRK